MSVDERFIFNLKLILLEEYSQLPMV